MKALSRTWPLAVRVPVLVAALMIAASIAISHSVLSRLAEDQENQLQALTGAYLDGLSAAIMPSVLRRDVWETFDGLDRARHRYAGITVVQAVVATPENTVIAAADPSSFPVQSAMPPDFLNHFSEAKLNINEDSGRAWAYQTLQEEGIFIGRIYVEIDIRELLKVRREVLYALVSVNVALTAIFSFLGYFLVLRMLKPVDLLTRRFQRVEQGADAPFSEREIQMASPEHRQVLLRFNAMIQALNEREALSSRLAEEERHSMLGKLASGMAHEVNNPLAGMLNAIDTIEVHGDKPEVRRSSLALLRRGIEGIRGVVRATLVTYKGTPNANSLKRADLDDLVFLAQHEIGVRHLELDWLNELPDDIELEGAVVRRIALNLLLNACAASPPNGKVEFHAAVQGADLLVTVADAGPGLPLPVREMIDRDIPYPSPPSGVKGLGLWTVQRECHQLGGRLTYADTSPGTTFLVTIPLPQPKESSYAVA